MTVKKQRRGKRRKYVFTSPKIQGILDEPLTPKQWELYQANQALIGFCYSRLRRRYSMYLNPLEQERLFECLDNRLIRAAQSYDATTGYKFATFAYACLVRTGWQDYLRDRDKRSRTQSLDQPAEVSGDTLLRSVPDPRARPEAEVSNRLDYPQQRLWLLLQMGERVLERIEQNVIEGRTYGEIARLEGVSPQAVRASVIKALDRVRDSLWCRVEGK